MTKPKMNGAESLVYTLVGHDLKICFANPGTSEMHFVAALDRIAGLRCIPGLQENVVTGMADGYARATIELREPAYQGSGSVLLRADGKPVRLSGISSGSARAEIALERCAELLVRLRPQPDSATRGGSKS